MGRTWEASRRGRGARAQMAGLAEVPASGPIFIPWKGACCAQGLCSPTWTWGRVTQPLRKSRSSSRSLLQCECVARGSALSRESPGGLHQHPDALRPPAHCQVPGVQSFLEEDVWVVGLGLGTGRVPWVPLQRQRYCRFPHNSTSTFNIYLVLVRY